MRSSQLAAEVGVNVQTLRYYERRGLLPEPDRLESGYRSYGTEAVRTVRFVKRAQQLGFSLEEVDSLLDLAAGGPDNCDAAKTLATTTLDHLEQKIANLTAMRDSLRQLVATCGRSRHNRDCPLLDAIEDPNETGTTTMGDHPVAAADVHIQILHVPDCPLVGGLRIVLDRSLSTSGLTATVEELEGPHPSPTLLINGADVSGRSGGLGPSCRLDLPTEAEILSALTPTGTQPWFYVGDGDEQCA